MYQLARKLKLAVKYLQSPSEREISTTFIRENKFVYSYNMKVPFENKNYRDIGSFGEITGIWDTDIERRESGIQGS